MTVIVKHKVPLVIPLAVRRQAGLKSGQEVEFKVTRGIISVLPKTKTARDEYTPAQRRIIDKELAKGLADIKAGRVRGPFSTHKEFISSLREEIKKLAHKKIKLST